MNNSGESPQLAAASVDTGFCERCGARLQEAPQRIPQGEGEECCMGDDELQEETPSSGLMSQAVTWQPHTVQMCYENGLVADGSIMAVALSQPSLAISESPKNFPNRVSSVGDHLDTNRLRRTHSQSDRSSQNHRLHRTWSHTLSAATRSTRDSSRDISAASLTRTQSIELELSAATGPHTSPSISLSDRHEHWKAFFDQYDHYNMGELCISDFKILLCDPNFRVQMEPHKLDLLEGKASEPTRESITFQEFISVISCKRSRSFKIAVDGDGGDAWSDTELHRFGGRYGRRNRCFSSMVRRVAKEFLVDERDRLYYADNYTCFPPPLFIPLISLLELSFFIYYALQKETLSASGPVPGDSIFIYRPDKRIEIWRFVFYMLIHAGWVHLFFNMLVQLLVGVPLEMVHGSLRIGTVYMAGVLAGSLGTSVFDIDAYLVGASGGVYALLAAHLANILLNYSEMELGIYKLAAVFIIASADVGFAIWDRYTNEEDDEPVGYVAHLMGALAGLTIGLLVLKNFEQKLHVQVLWWLALGIYSAATLFAILWNLFYY